MAGILQAFKLEEKDLKNVIKIAPAGKDYFVELAEGQELGLSKSGKTVHIIDEPHRVKSFRVNKTVFVLKRSDV